jgi:pimeloyl-ACP methyl ester carboxylesterase
LICNPAGHEYERCHKALRQLAVQLARAGGHAMRFDYSGAGDSDGDAETASLAGWRRDIGDAVLECRRQAARPRVTVVGLRLGATLAAQVAAERDDIDAMVMYAPVTDHQALFAEWSHAQALHARTQGRRQASGNPTDVLGYPITDRFRTELAQGLGVPGPRSSLRRVLILSEASAHPQLDDLAQTMGINGACVTVETHEAAAIWRREPREAVVPFKLIRRILSWMKEGRQ